MHRNTPRSFETLLNVQHFKNSQRQEEHDGGWLQVRGQRDHRERLLVRRAERRGGERAVRREGLGVLERAARLPVESAPLLPRAGAESDVAVVVTEWNEFRALTPAHYLDAMRGKVLVDLRNIYRPEDMREAGLSYYSIGRA